MSIFVLCYEPVLPVPVSDATPSPAAVLESLTLLATLSTASDVRQAVAERRAGHDPSAQESTARAQERIREACTPLTNTALYLLRSTVPAASDEVPMAAVVRHFDERMLVYRMGQWAHDIHQALLSLYPRVSEALVEEARAVSNLAEALTEAPADVFVDELHTVAQQALSLTAWAHREIDDVL